MEFVVDHIVSGLFWLLAVCTMAVGMALVVSKTLPRIRNKASRFVVLFMLGVPFGAVYLYSKVWLLGYANMSWTEALIWTVPVDLLFAVLFTFWSPLSENSSSR